MRFKRLVWHIFPANLLITIGSLLAILWYSSSALDGFYRDWLTADLEDRGYLVEEQISTLLAAGERGELNNLCRRIGRKTATRITVIDADGVVLADSDENPARMDNHGGRPEVRTAMAGGVGSKLRFSATLGEARIYVAIPLTYNDSPDGQRRFNVLRMSMPASAIDQTLQAIRWKVALSGGMVALLAMLAAIIVSRRISQPLEEMTDGVKQLSRENFSASLSLAGNCSLELTTLAAAINGMAQKLRERFDTIVRQRNELQTILASMAEAVFVIDNDGRITTINPSACRLFGVDKEKALGKKTQEIVRSLEIDRVVELTLKRPDAVAEEMIFDNGADGLFLQYSGVRLHDDDGGSFGAVITFNDVTDIRRLEGVRREFVANVSHELMTPLTSIKGYAETIIDSTGDDRGQTEKFLRIILRQADQLQSIVNDLLALSRIENDMERNGIDLASVMVKPVLEEAVLLCGHRAAERDIKIELDCPNELAALLSVELMVRAVSNLLINAVKYSDIGGRVLISAAQQQAKAGRRSGVIITVRDYGMGIEERHLSRLFERFYRSDKARSRRLGGTGLGLAIVKHIVQAHNGTVQVESEVGKGTVFWIFIPV